MNPAVVGALELLMALSASKTITPMFKRSARISAVTRSLQTNIGWGPLDYQVDQMISVIMTLMTIGIVRAMVRTIMTQEEPHCTYYEALSIHDKTCPNKPAYRFHIVQDGRKTEMGTLCEEHARLVVERNFEAKLSDMELGILRWERMLTQKEKVSKQVSLPAGTKLFHIAREEDIPSIMRRGLDPPVFMIVGEKAFDSLIEGLDGYKGLRISLPLGWSVFPDEAFYEKGGPVVYVVSHKRVKPSMIHRVTPVMTQLYSSGKSPSDYLTIGGRRLGPFRTSSEADTAIKRIDYWSLSGKEHTKHGPAYLMILDSYKTKYVMYHACPLSRLDQVLRVGLKTGSKSHLAEPFGFPSKGLYLASTPESVSMFATMPGYPTEVLEVTIPSNWVLWLDPETDNEFYLAQNTSLFISKRDIPPDHIAVAPKEIRDQVYDSAINMFRGTPFERESLEHIKSIRHQCEGAAQSAEDRVDYFINMGTTMTVLKEPPGVRTIVKVHPRDSLWGRYEEKEFYGKDVYISVNAAIDWMHEVMIGKIRAVGRKLVVGEKPSEN